jgi:hypothetical protein
MVNVKNIAKYAEDLHFVNMINVKMDVKNVTKITFVNTIKIKEIVKNVGIVIVNIKYERKDA